MVDADPEPELAAATEDLYGLDPSEFVPARNELVRRLRTDGDRDRATRVAALRRPSPSAWAVNQLARSHGDELDGLLRLGEALRVAQTQALAGADAATLRQAGRARRTGVADLTEAAMGLLAERGQGADTHRGEVAATLEAASLDPRAATEVASGRLTSALEPPSGFDSVAAGEGASVGPASGPVAPAGEDGPAAGDPGAAEQAATLAAAERALTDADAFATDMAADARDAAATAERRRKDVAEAEAEVSRLQRALDEARGRVTAGRRGAERAEKAAEAAQAAATEAETRRRHAERRVADLTE